jgi:hypothetical protein
MRRLVRTTLAVTLLLAAAFGCDLLNDATKFTVETDWQVFSVDSAQLGLKVPSGSVIPAVSCTAANDICAQASSGISCAGPSFTCAVKCGSGGTCELAASTEIFTSIDLSSQIKNQTQASALSKVALDRVVLNTDENTLSFATPKVELYVGPSAASKITDAGVVLFGTLPAIAAKQILNEAVNVTEAGKNALSDFVKNYQTPFRMFAKASIGFASGDPLPQGKLTLKVKAYFQVEPLK